MILRLSLFKTEEILYGVGFSSEAIFGQTRKSRDGEINKKEATHFYCTLLQLKPTIIQATTVQDHLTNMGASCSVDESSVNIIPSNRYLCASEGILSELDISDDGVFTLTVESKQGAAQGKCSAKECSIQMVSQKATSFVGDRPSFSFISSHRAILINETVRCDVLTD